MPWAKLGWVLPRAPCVTAAVDHCPLRPPARLLAPASAASGHRPRASLRPSRAKRSRSPLRRCPRPPPRPVPPHGGDDATHTHPHAQICRLFGGFFLSPKNLPPYFYWLDALSYVKYTYVGISLNELTGLELTCTPSQLTAKGTCPIPNGDFTINALGLNAYTIPMCAGILIAYIFVCRFIAYLAIRFIKH